MIRLIHAVIVASEDYKKDMTFDEAAEGDYIYHAIFDINKDKCIFHDDNIHDDPTKLLQGITLGARLADTLIDVTKIVLPLQEGEVENKVADVCTAFRRWKGENLD